MYNPDCFTGPAAYLKGYRDLYIMIHKTQMTLGTRHFAPCLYDVYVSPVVQNWEWSSCEWTKWLVLGSTSCKENSSCEFIWQKPSSEGIHTTYHWLPQPCELCVWSSTSCHEEMGQNVLKLKKVGLILPPHSPSLWAMQKLDSSWRLWSLIGNQDQLTFTWEGRQWIF